MMLYGRGVQGVCCLVAMKYSSRCSSRVNQIMMVIRLVAEFACHNGVSNQAKKWWLVVFRITISFTIIHTIYSIGSTENMLIRIIHMKYIFLLMRRLARLSSRLY